jgi:hypothetical protein
LVLEAEPEKASVHLLKHLCSAQYREFYEGKPDPVLTGPSEFGDALSDGPPIARGLEISDRVVILQREQGQSKPFGAATRLSDVLKELSLKRPGYLVIETDRPNEVATQLAEKAKPEQLDIHVVRPRVALEDLSTLVRVAFGFLEGGVKGTPDEVFLSHEKAYRTAIDKLVADSSYQNFVKRSQAGNGREDRVHFALKVFTVRDLAERYCLSRDLLSTRISTEVPVDRGVADVALDSHQYYEVETLFGAGVAPLKNLDETLEKYDAGRNVCFVLEPLSMLRHYHELRRRLRDWARDRRLGKVEVAIPNLSSRRLLTLEDVGRTPEFLRLRESLGMASAP